MIVQGTFSQCVKTGVYFNVEGGPDQVFTGDLFYDVAKQEFQIRGVPAIGRFKRHVFDEKFRGPTKIDLRVVSLEEKPRDDGTNYIDLRFRKAKTSGEFAAWIEEWFGDLSIMRLIDAEWEILGDLTWFRA